MILEIIERNPKLGTITEKHGMRISGDTIAFRTIFEQLMMSPGNPTHTPPKVQGNTGITYKNPLFSLYGLPPLQPTPVGVRMNEILRE